jgi:outer membrane lipoprotein-sorting protein
MATVSFSPSRLLVFLLFNALSTLLVGQKSDQASLTLLKELKAHYTAYKSMSMDFSLQIKDLENSMDETRKGSMWVQGAKFRIQMDKQFIISDAKSIWVYQEDVNEVQINNYDADQEDFMSPSELFNLTEADYLVLSGGSVTEGGVSYRIIELSPLDKSLDYHKIKLYIPAGAKTLKKAVVLGKDGIHYTYRIDKFTANPAVTEETFRFYPERYLNIEVIDLRD